MPHGDGTVHGSVMRWPVDDDASMAAMTRCKPGTTSVGYPERTDGGTSRGLNFSMVASVVLLGVAMKHLPAGTAYAVWTGIGTVGTVILGIVLMGEPASAVRLGCLALIMIGIIGLKLTG